MFWRPGVPERYLGDSTPHEREKALQASLPSLWGWAVGRGTDCQEASEAGNEGRGRERAVGLARCHVTHMLRPNKRVYMEPEMARHSHTR